MLVPRGITLFLPWTRCVKTGFPNRSRDPPIHFEPRSIILSAIRIPICRANSC
jgi:hypothetical protein